MSNVVDLIKLIGCEQDCEIISEHIAVYIENKKERSGRIITDLSNIDWIAEPIYSARSIIDKDDNEIGAVLTIKHKSTNQIGLKIGGKYEYIVIIGEDTYCGLFSGLHDERYKHVPIGVSTMGKNVDVLSILGRTFKVKFNHKTDYKATVLYEV